MSLARVATATLILCFLIPPAASEAESGGPLGVRNVLLRVGDDPSWSQPDFDDSGWTKVEFDEISDDKRVLWVRAEVDLEERNVIAGRPVGLYVAGMASHEVFWDGQPIASGGRVGATAADEVPGPIEAVYPIPDRLAAPGRHHLALRLSAHHRHFRPKAGYWALVVGDYGRLTAAAQNFNRWALVSLSGIVMVSIFAFLLYLLDRRDRSFLALALLCLTAALLLVAESWRNLVGYTYNWHLLRLGILAGLSWALGLLLLLFLARRFPMRHGRWVVIAGVSASAAALFVLRSWDAKSLVGFLIVFGLGLGWALAALLRAQRGAALAAAGLGFCFLVLIWNPAAFLDRSLYPALNVLLVCLLASHALQVRRVREGREAALLKSARLESELLKRHLQPHFLMNTLTALCEWIEEEPRVAVKMIQSLAEEFRVLSEISNRKLIPLRDEIRLCRSHLEIMSGRRARRYELATHGIDLEAEVPPAVIHTLVENAVTHSGAIGGDDELIELRLRAERNGRAWRYRFEAPAGSAAGTGEPRDGTGLRYIKARLQESFGDDWTLASGRRGGLWITEIELPARSRSDTA